jgi:putative hydrolase of the HAD superfamily
MRRERIRAFFAGLGEFLDDSEVVRLEDRRVAAMQRQWQVFADSVPCLDWLRRAGLRVVAITNASGAHQRAKLTTLGLIDFFDHVLIAGELGVAKPDPVIFHTACAALGVRPAEVVHIGDLLDVDAVAARDAGMRGVWLDRHGRAGAQLPDGVQSISSLAELPELLLCDL